MRNIVLLLVLVMAFGFVLGANANSPEMPGRYSLHQVRAGETLWGISEKYMPETDPRLGVEWISQVNGLGGAIIHPGDILNVPDFDGPLLEPLGPEYGSKEAARAAEMELHRILGGNKKLTWLNEETRLIGGIIDNVSKSYQGADGKFNPGGAWVGCINGTAGIQKHQLDK